MTSITSLPYTISSPGLYKLGSNLDAYQLGVGANAITIAANDVTLDFDGYYLLNSGSSSGAVFGIYALNRSNVRILNAHIIGMGFLYGIRFDNSDGFTSTGNIEIDNALIRNVGFHGINVQANNVVVKNSHVHGIGGNTFNTATYNYMKGIEVRGNVPVIMNNLVEEVYGYTNLDGESVGISLAGSCHNGVIFNNIVRNVNKVDRSIGVWAGQDQSNNQVVNNHISNYRRALFGAAQTGFAQDNYTVNVGGEGHPMFDIPGENEWTGNNMGT
jgi:hypothetical protein